MWQVNDHMTRINVKPYIYYNLQKLIWNCNRGLVLLFLTVFNQYFFDQINAAFVNILFKNKKNYWFKLLNNSVYIYYIETNIYSILIYIFYFLITQYIAYIHYQTCMLTNVQKLWNYIRNIQNAIYQNFILNFEFYFSDFQCSLRLLDPTVYVTKYSCTTIWTMYI